MTDDALDPFDQNLQHMTDEETAEWSCRSLIRSLLQPRNESADVSEALDYARRILEAGAEGLLKRALAIEEEDERIDAYGDIEFLVEGAIRIASAAGMSGAAVGNDVPASPVPNVEKAPEVDRAARCHAGRSLGARAPIIAALRKLYPDGDPVILGMHRETLRSNIARELNLVIDKIDPKTLDRARKNAWQKAHI